MVANPRPSALHTRRVVVFSHEASPGVHIDDGWHCPIMQVVAEGQSISTGARPRASQTRTRDDDTQVRELGTHRCAAHVASVVQSVPAGQSRSSAHSTHWLRRVSQTSPSSEHSRDERQVRGGGRQLFDRHTRPSRQSASVTQSTQTPRVGSHTCPGHIRDEVHATAATQRYDAHSRPAEQFAAVMHSTQRRSGRRHTRPDATQASSAAHVRAPSGVTSTTGVSVRSALASRPLRGGGASSPEQPARPPTKQHARHA